MRGATFTKPLILGPNAPWRPDLEHKIVPGKVIQLAMVGGLILTGQLSEIGNEGKIIFPPDFQKLAIAGQDCR